VVVNGGTSCYGLGAQRLRERGTAWHSTVQVGSGDSSEVWSGFRVGRRARICERRIEGWTIRGAHDGWRIWPGAPRHRREWSISAGGMVVDDRLAPLTESTPEATARFHLAPGLALTPTDGRRRWAVVKGPCSVAEVDVEAGDATVTTSCHAPRFGVLEASQSLSVVLRDGHARTHWHWSADAHPLSH
jgi:uncharacterized heparinase superfamily protein